MDYDVPSYGEFASHMLAQPQPYGLDAVTSVPVAADLLHTSLAVYDRRLRNLYNVRERMLSGLEEQLEQLGDVTDQMASLVNQRDALVSPLRLPRRATFDPFSLQEELRTRPPWRPKRLNFDTPPYESPGYSPFVLRPRPKVRRFTFADMSADTVLDEDVSRYPILTLEEIMGPLPPPTPRWRRRARAIFNPLRRVMDRRRESRRRMRRIVVPDYVDPVYAQQLRDQEYYRVQDLFDNANPRQLRKLLKDPYYRKFYDGDNSHSFWGY